jgi:acyl-CoA reductase-like NAD-dependent aldehyde dehydrogenase
VGRVALVLGAGNIAAIAPLDLLTKLIGEGQVCLLKLNPIGDYLAPFFATIFAPLIDAGFVQLAQGDAAVGAYLCAHEWVDTIHVTGSARTHDAIVYGSGPEGAGRKIRDEPLLDKPLTSELGNVSPLIVVPGPWEAADLRFQAEQIASQKFHNAGFACIAAQVLVTPGEWDQEAALLDTLRATIRRLADRPPYYPGAAQRLAALRQQYPEAENLSTSPESSRLLITNLAPGEGNEGCFAEEIFGGALAQTSLPGRDAADYLRNAVRFCNERLHGTLGVNLLIHPATIRELGPALDQAITALRYGCVAINAWTGVGFLLNQVPWGAFPGNTRPHVGSGSGFVHNSFLFDRPQKSVIRGPFRPFPRAILRGEPTVLSKPPWFVTNNRQAALARKLIAFELDPGVRHLPGIFAEALRGG